MVVMMMMVVRENEKEVDQFDNVREELQELVAKMCVGMMGGE
jgi:hypothetical protein